MLQEFQRAINDSYLGKSWGQGRDWGLKYAALKGYAGHGYAANCNGKTFRMRSTVCRDRSAKQREASERL